MKKFLVILTICISVFSITAFAAPSITFDDKIVKDLGNSWIVITKNDSYHFLCKVKDGDIKKVNSEGIYFNSDVVVYSTTGDGWEKMTSNSVLFNASSPEFTVYISGIDNTRFNGIQAHVVQEKVGNLNFHQPSFLDKQQGNLATMTKDFSQTCSKISKVALLGLAILLSAPLIVRVVRSYL